jgi:hypothetical protein
MGLVIASDAMRTDWRILGTRCCVGYALHASQAANRKEFLRKFEDFASPETGGWGLDPRLLRAWEAGRRYISKGLVYRIETQVAGTKIVYVIAALLQRTYMSAAGVKLIVEPLCTRTEGVRWWKLPCLDATFATGDATRLYEWRDSASLVMRGDFPGFLAILALLRISVINFDYYHVRRYAQDLYAILPSVCRIGWVRRDVDLLLQCIEDKMKGIRWFPAQITIDWDAFREEVIHPRPWTGTPPWILGFSSDVATPSQTQRPVPLLEDVVPLQRYVRGPSPVRRLSDRKIRAFKALHGRPVDSRG